MRRFALFLIRLYQRFISPHKGFCCAYRVYTGRSSCSQLGYRAIRRRGLWRGIALIRRRTFLCGVAHRKMHQPRPPSLQSQAGFCDVGCDLPCHGGCDVPHVSGCDLAGDHLASKLCDASSCCDCCGCDTFDWRRKRKANDGYVYIPPNSKWVDDGTRPNQE